MIPHRTVLAVILLMGAAGAQVTERVSISSLGIEGNGDCDLTAAVNCVSADGRFVAFTSGASNLVPGDTAWNDVFIRDRQSGTTERLSLDSAGNQANGDSRTYGLSMSNDGRFVAFYSEANNLVPGDLNGGTDIFVRDRLNGTIERVSLAWNGAEGDGSSWYPAISADGRYVVFTSLSTNLVPGDSNGMKDVFVRDRQAGTTERVSVSSAGTQSMGNSALGSISADGRYVTFESNAQNLVHGDTNGRWDAFVRDRQTGTTRRVSVATDGSQGNSDSGVAIVCGNGRYVAFWSTASNLVAGDTNGQPDIFLHDLRTGTTRRVNEGPGGLQANNSAYFNSISADGRFVAFLSYATNLIPGDTSPYPDILVHDMLTGTNEVMSSSTDGAPAADYSDMPSISADGRFVAFRSSAANLVAGDSNGKWDIFLHDRLASGFTSLCDPGTGGVTACPCFNPPSSRARGCDNSSFTGGAALTASGFAYLSIDSLVFSTSNETPSATSMLLQGNSSLPNGLVFGQGVRCAGGTLLRLYVKTAVLGSITAPELSIGDPTISSRCAALGAPIQPGEPHLYLVYYRDSTVLGGCPASSTFNATQTAEISWWP
jgi:Tol biopolymer transport system component